MLSKVTWQDIEINDQQEPEIRQGIGKGRITSTFDPEMRHGHKPARDFLADIKTVY